MPKELIEHRCVWGAPVPERNFAGVAFLYRISSVWSVQKVAFCNKACDKFYSDGRLLCVQLFRNSEKHSILIYILYGKSGARWEPPKMKYNQDMVSAVQEDVVSRGEVSAVMCGDFNMTVEEAGDTFAKLRYGRWVDSAMFGICGFDNSPTSLQGKGARIDLAFLNHNATRSMKRYSLMEGVAGARHHLLDLNFSDVLAAQFIYMQKTLQCRGQFSRPGPGYEPPTISVDLDIRACLSLKDIDKAMQLWSKRAEGLLCTIPLMDGSFVKGSGRGKVRMRRLCAWPPEREVFAETVWLRKLARALRRAQELARLAFWGYRADQTVAYLRTFWKETHGPLRELLDPLFTQTPSPAVFSEVQQILQTEYRSQRTLHQKARISAWKRRMQASEKLCHRWIQGKAKLEVVPMKLRNGEYTIDRNEQLNAILSEWEPIFNKFKSQPVDVASFCQHFGATMKGSPMSLDPLTPQQIVDAAKATTESSASLDNWRPSALTALAWWFPGLFVDLAAIYNAMELSGDLPESFLLAYTSLIPKDTSLEDAGPTDFRPITVLTAVYRLWVKARFDQVLQWQESWVTPEVFGCRKGHNAEQMMAQISLDVESPAFSDNSFVSGVAYDYRKAFDLVPHEIMLQAMQLRGCHPRILAVLGSLYKGLQRVFKLHGALGQWWRAYNGLVQGDALSMVALNSVVTCIVEATKALNTDNIRPRTYADDISAVVLGPSKQDVLNDLRRFHNIVKAYSNAGCGELNSKKCFTFGDKVAAGALDEQFQHVQEFCIVGGSFVFRENANLLTNLEKKRLSKWKNSVKRVKHIPRSWMARARLMLATQSQATYGQGTHSIVTDQRCLRGIRSDIMRVLWQQDTYSHSPLITMSLLCPVQLDPEFGVIYEGLRMIMRNMRNLRFAATIRQRFQEQPRKICDGPTARLVLLSQDDTLGPLVQQLLCGQIQEDEWLHNLRDAWRVHLWKRVHAERPQHYAGVDKLDRGRTLKWYKTLEFESNLDGEDAKSEQIIRARLQLGTLRTIFAGGLMTPERAARHKRQDVECICSCGADRETIDHVSWHCSIYKEARDLLFRQIQCHLSDFPVCFRYAALVPEDFFLSDESIQKVQQFLVSTWSTHIRRWYEGKDLENRETAATGEVRARQVGTDDVTVYENGHTILPRTEGRQGVWCNRCGRFTYNLRHVRLKITKHPCPYPNGEPLQREGFLDSTTRLDELEHDLNTRFNTGGHELLWNRSTRKEIDHPDEGKIWCLKCRKQWRWKDRQTYLPRAACIPNHTVRPSKRIHGKRTKSSLQETLISLPMHEASAASSSQALFDRVGVG